MKNRILSSVLPLSYGSSYFSLLINLMKSIWLWEPHPRWKIADRSYLSHFGTQQLAGDSVQRAKHGFKPYVTALVEKLATQNSTNLAGIHPIVEMNPILLKPQGDMTSQVIIKGKMP